jgi:Collagen triple helix repeat (20 copies)
MTQVSGVGPRGPQGPTGPVGPDGPQGLTGLTGPQGQTGPTGPQGLMGVQGATGPPGPQGQQGPSGPVGLVWMGPWNASITYAVNDAVSYGGSSYIALQTNTDSEPPNGDWSLVSAQGLPGLQGPAGSAGPAGPTGLTGPQGPQGSTGAAGPPGPQGAPGVSGRVKILTSTVAQTLVAGAQMTGAAACPAGTVVFSGGFVNNSNFVMVASRYQGDSAWWVTFQNTSNKNQSVIVTPEAICGIVQ